MKPPPLKAKAFVIMEKNRKCACCKEIKMIDNFYKSGKYMGSYCKPCYSLKHFKNHVFLIL